MHQLVCQKCGKTFLAPHWNKYCSRACYRPPGRKSPLSAEQEAEICRLYTEPNERGWLMGVDTISRLTNVKRETVHHVLERKGIPRRAKTFYVQNQPHHNLTRVPPDGEQPPLCHCGCGQRTRWIRTKDRWARYVEGHYTQDGEQNHAWNGGTSRIPYPGNWKYVRRRTFQRDNWTCQDCGRYAKGEKYVLDIHHIDSNPANSVATNLLTLCDECHHIRHGQRIR
jgi:5-methylcytosine-specific restriction endonuclease McrA